MSLDTAIVTGVEKGHPRVLACARAILSLIFAASSVSCLLATTYYVAATYGHDTNSGVSPSDPWKSLEKVNTSIFYPGDQILFRRNDTWYGELKPSCSGAPKEKIVIGAYGGGSAPTIDCSGVFDNAIRIAKQDYITIQDIHCRNWCGQGIYVTNSRSVTIERCIVSGGDGIPPDHGIHIQGSSEALLTDIAVRDNRIGLIGLSENDTVFFSGILVQGVHRATVSDNQINTSNTAAIFLMRSGEEKNIDCIIQRNEVVDCYSGILVYDSDRTFVGYNRIHNGCGVGVGVNRSNDVRIHYNLIYDLKPSRNLWNGIDINHDSQNGQVINNTLFGVYRHCLMIDDETAACDGWLFKNNILDASQNSGSVKLGLGVRGPVSYESDYNLLWAGEGQPVASFGDFQYEPGDVFHFREYQVISGQDGNSANFDPGFVDFVTSDFTLDLSSPCIDAGIDFRLPQDLVGTSVPQGKGADIGALELVSIQSPKNLRLRIN